MAEGQRPARRKRLLTPEEKYEIRVQVLTHQLTQAEAAVRWGVDPTTVMKLRRVAKEGALTALAAARPGRPRQPEEDAELAAAKAEVAADLRAVQDPAPILVVTGPNVRAPDVFA